MLGNLQPGGKGLEISLAAMGRLRIDDSLVRSVCL